MKPVEQLAALLKEIGAHVTYDVERNVAHPCMLCGEQEQDRTLVKIGVYTRPLGGNIQPGDAIERPLCASCIARTNAP